MSGDDVTRKGVVLISRDVKYHDLECGDFVHEDFKHKHRSISSRVVKVIGAKWSKSMKLLSVA